MSGLRIGFGFDVHPLKEGRAFMLGGIEIPHTHGADGHSDADVLIHAICDALLGAGNLRDIGYHFPNTDARYKDIDSKKLLALVVDLLTERQYSIVNIDATLVLEQPKINPYVEAMRAALAPILHTDINNISIKATTNEGMGFVGRKEGVTAYAVCLIEKNEAIV